MCTNLQKNLSGLVDTRLNMTSSIATSTAILNSASILQPFQSRPPLARIHYQGIIRAGGERRGRSRSSQTPGNTTVIPYVLSTHARTRSAAVAVRNNNKQRRLLITPRATAASTRGSVDTGATTQDLRQRDETFALKQ
ncbi:hypothetical protein J6590_042063 [Homalodisca vitripennis]|nr:hypothetical protein J6590_042063 [Homalodisca vitripennis]